MKNNNSSKSSVSKVTEFQKKVYELTKCIPKGKVSTYKAIADKMNTNAYRAVGSALNKNPFAPIVPCHRVVNNNGNLGGFASGSKNKIKILESEGLIIKNNKIIDFDKKLYKF